MLALLFVAAGCGGDGGSAPAGSARQSTPPPAAADLGLREEPASARAERPRIVALGDSLTAGYGLDLDEAYPAVLQRRLAEAGYQYEVVNAGVSGDTTAGGVRRLDWSLDGDVRVLIVALGGNDGLRGLPVEAMRRNLSAIIARAGEKGAHVILAGMEAPPNLGEGYTAAFRGVFRDLAEEHDVTLVPFLLDGVAGREELNLRDRIHPNVEGARQVAENLWPALISVLGSPANP